MSTGGRQTLRPAKATGCPATLRGPGRPKDLEKRAAIIAAATALFMENGFEPVRMDDVAEAAGVSKMTVYGHFQDKAALFAACVRASCDEMLAQLAPLRERKGDVDLEGALVAFGIAFLTRILGLRLAVRFHMLMGTLIKDPELARSFYEAGPGNTRDTLSKVLEAAANLGELVVNSPHDAASDLLSLWEGDVSKAIALGVRPPLTEAEIARRVQRGTAVFLRAYRPSRFSP